MAEQTIPFQNDESLLDISLSHQQTTVDAEHFAKLYQIYTYPIFNYCIFRVGDQATAEDLTADIFERAWQARRRYQPERATFRTWLFTIARRMVTDWQRRQARRPLLRLTDRHPTNTPSLELTIEENEQQARLRRLVRTLAPAEQELIAFKFGAGMTNRHIAAVLDKSESAIGSALYRLMQKLRAKWEAMT